jgi:hypothetical protein
MLTEIILLLSLLVIVLIFLGRKNSKLLEKVAILEKTVALKAESIAHFKTVYSDALKANAVHDEQVEKIGQQAKRIRELESIEESLEKKYKRKKNYSKRRISVTRVR